MSADDIETTQRIPVSVEPASPSCQSEIAMIPSAACPEVLARAESVDGRGLERIAAALETIGLSLTALVERLSVSEPSTAQGEPVEPAVAPVQSAHRDNGLGAVSAKSPRSALQEASSRQNGIGAVSPNGNGTGRYPVDTRAEIASISASIDAKEEEVALQAMRDAERDAEGEDASWVNSVWNTMDGEADA